MPDEFNNRLKEPTGIFVDEDQTMIYIADAENHRIVQYKEDDTNVQVVAGGNGPGSGFRQLNYPTDVLIDKKKNVLVICNLKNQRVVQLSRYIGTVRGILLVDNIHCFGLAMDEQRNLYVPDSEKDEV